VNNKKDTSWSAAADWYNAYLETEEDSYQRKVILPNLLRLVAPKKGLRIMDIACGQGFFTREFAKAGAAVVGTDISKELITKAKKLSPKTIPYHAAPAHKLDFAKNGALDVATIVLAIQNIGNIMEVFKEAARILKPDGKLYLVMMHPAFRVPKETSWGFDEETKIQYRRVDGYLSASKTELLVHPGKKDSPTTISYHRSLQDFSKALSKAGFAITKIEEWISHKESQPGPRQKAENTARKEIPLFMMLEAQALKS
jgi:ubiquinone/menaquinone biosynthesis C-methylase UbiE